MTRTTLPRQLRVELIFDISEDDYQELAGLLADEDIEFDKWSRLTDNAVLATFPPHVTRNMIEDWELR
jgi:hypothetical protein